jgi:hypothetical protein
MVFGYEVTLRTTGTPAEEKNLENHRNACRREKHLWKTPWLSFLKLFESLCNLIPEEKPKTIFTSV